MKWRSGAAGLALWCMLSTGVSGEETLLSHHKLTAGIYVWDGLGAAGGRGSGLAQGVAEVDAAGFHAIRMLLSPASQRSYAMPPLRCAGGARTLSCLYLDEGLQRALAIKTIGIVMFTAYDFASYPRQHFLDAEFLRANRQRVFDEYRELAETILRTNSGSGRIFLIGHWEGDNQVYCGSSYDFQTVDEKRYGCLPQEPEKRLAGLTEWLRIRQEAIAEGRRRAIAAGAVNVEIYHAAEFNTIFATRKVSGASIRSKEFKGVLDTVVPAVHPDICSYSAWESVNRNRLTKDLEDIVKACGPAPVIVGEIGIKENADKRYGKLISALQPLRESIPLVFFWQAFDSPGSKEVGFALFGSDGKALHPRALADIGQLENPGASRRK
jgi:hypothetical protein